VIETFCAPVAVNYMMCADELRHSRQSSDRRARADVRNSGC
jgi:hypothetical protein